MSANKVSNKQATQKILNSAGFDTSTFIRVKFPTSNLKKVNKSRFSTSALPKLAQDK